jgi:A/G-specific adenine glycosylase
MERHQGKVPSEREDLLALPGVGPYTAGAIASVAFARPEPVVDGNVKRVFSRLLASNVPERRMWELASDLVRGRSPGDLNQALMELGATVCTPRSPKCDACPWSESCRARKLGRPESYPAALPRAPVRAVRIEAAWVERSGKILLARATDGSPLRGAWDVPAGNLHTSFTTGPVIVRVSHTILARRLEIDVVRAKVRGRLSAKDYRWVDPAALAEVATSGATTKIVRAVYAASSTSSSGSRGRVTRKDFPSISGTAPKATSSPAQ